MIDVPTCELCLKHIRTEAKNSSRYNLANDENIRSTSADLFLHVVNLLIMQGQLVLAPGLCIHCFGDVMRCFFLQRC